ncbi:MAG TPA: type I pantothenate kinase [Vineibacter sp.]|nr:type I pantothenate kinase [Vineibacter sp.]
MAERQHGLPGETRSRGRVVRAREAAAAPAGDPDLSPYQHFARAEWAALRANTAASLKPDELATLRSLNDRLDLREVEEIYLPLSRLLAMHVRARRKLARGRGRFLDVEDNALPYVIGIAGSVAVGKSTTARVLQALLAGLPDMPRVDLVTTDGFLFPKAVLESERLMERKGFPESYDRPAMLRFLHDVKAGKRQVAAPVYSHLSYDVMPGEQVVVDRPDVLIFEGLNVLQPARLPKDGKAIPFVSDFFDFSIYVDADEDVLQRWYIARFMRLRETTFRDPRSHFHKYAALSETDAVATATSIWTRINLVNLRENILPTRQRASLILRKGESHLIDEVMLRKL